MNKDLRVGKGRACVGTVNEGGGVVRLSRQEGVHPPSEV